ncbi:phosphoglycolate phosphatase [Caenimonas sp. SL110]|uniref:phosphoglycolate phosphatase n=1 Tax=Caenimonas sp. SL110 TaxID=1450524 RepID=UPI000653AA7B|nr:phosphoglycolate phosphatase [Caenimonas sp. SL110]
MRHIKSLEVDAAIVDLDGTLVDTLDDFRVALNLMLSDLGLAHLEKSVIEPMIGRGSENLIRAVLARVGASDALYQDAWQSYQKHYLSINGQHSAVFDGAVAGLEVLRAHGLRLACLTNKPQAFAAALLEAKGLASYFDVVFGGDAFERKKPDPLPLVKTCEALGTRPARTLMIGDSSNDAAAARAAGCPVVLVTYGYNHGEPVRAVDCDGFLESLALLGQWLGPRR